MIVYLLKFILCSAVLFTFYRAVLINERLFRFNRFFLISIMILAAIIPAVTVKTKVIEVPVEQVVPLSHNPVAFESEAGAGTSQLFQIPDLDTIMLWVYLLVAAVFLARLCLNLWSLYRFKKEGSIIRQDGLKLVLRSDITQSFSFATSMYTNKEQYEQGMLPREVVAHEKAHIDQRHSYDIVFIEFLTCLCWFNPTVYLLKRAIQLNHEFLADEAAVRETGSLVQYQNIIIQYASRQITISPALASHLTFGETKKRIIIMAKTQNKKMAIAKQTVAMAVIIMLLISLGKTKVIAQEDKSAKPIITTAVPFLTMDEVILSADTLEVKAKKMIIRADTLRIRRSQMAQDQKKRPEPPMLISVIPRASSRVRYTNNQGERVTAIFGDLPDRIRKDFADLKLDGEVWMAPKPKADISQAMLDDFKNATKYGVWIDGSKVENAVLNRYSPEDFHHFFKSKLGKGARHYGQYTYHLALVTQKTFEKVPTNMTGMWIKYSEQVARARKFLDPVEEKN